MKETIFYETPEGRKICPDLGAYVFEGHDENGNEIYRDPTSLKSKKITVKPYYGTKCEKLPPEYQAAGFHVYDSDDEHKTEIYSFDYANEKGQTKLTCEFPVL